MVGQFFHNNIILCLFSFDVTCSSNVNGAMCAGKDVASPLMHQVDCSATS